MCVCFNQNEHITYMHMYIVTYSCTTVSYFECLVGGRPSA